MLTRIKSECENRCVHSAHKFHNNGYLWKPRERNDIKKALAGVCTLIVVFYFKNWEEDRQIDHRQIDIQSQFTSVFTAIVLYLLIRSLLIHMIIPKLLIVF